MDDLEPDRRTGFRDAEWHANPRRSNHAACQRQHDDPLVHDELDERRLVKALDNVVDEDVAYLLGNGSSDFKAVGLRAKPSSVRSRCVFHGDRTRTLTVTRTSGNGTVDTFTITSNAAPGSGTIILDRVIKLGNRVQVDRPRSRSNPIPDFCCYAVMQLIERGLTPYREAWELQREIFQRVIAGEEDDTLILVEHPPVYTLGRGAEKHDNGALANFLLSDEKLHELGAEKSEIERGGDVTYQRSGAACRISDSYLGHFREDLGWYLRALEETIIEVLRTYGVDSFRIAGGTEVWVGAERHEEKICDLGIHASRWCTMHGFAFNVNTDLSYFQYIVPCGIRDRGVTSLKKILGRNIDMEEVRRAILRGI